MNHLFRAKRMGYEEKRDGIYFDANLYSLEEAIAQFKPFQGISQKGYPYTGYEYKGVKSEIPACAAHLHGQVGTQ